MEQRLRRIHSLHPSLVLGQEGMPDNLKTSFSFFECSYDQETLNTCSRAQFNTLLGQEGILEGTAVRFHSQC